MSATLASLQIGSVRSIATSGSREWWDKSWDTGFFKESVSGPVQLTRTGLAGDRQADLTVHGGPDKAVCVYAAEHYPAWRQELNLDLPAGAALGENFTVTGLLEPEVCVGDIYTIGTARVQVTQPRQPCWKLARRWRIKDLTVRVVANGRTGFYFRVMEEGLVAAGDTIHFQDRPYPEWTITECNRLMHHAKADRDARRALATCPALSVRWRETLGE